MSDLFLSWMIGDNGGAYREVWFAFGVPVGVWGGCVLLVLVFGISLWFWQRRLGRVPLAFGLALLRSAGVMLALFLFLEPGLVARRLQPGTHFVPVLFDDSQSMTVPDEGGQTRAERLLAAYHASGVEAALRQSHQVVLFRFGEGIERAPHVSALTFAQHESRIHGAVREVLQRLRGVSVSAVVVFSDGAQQGQDLVAVDELSFEVPVITVGVGREETWRDLALAGVSVSQGDDVAVTARVRADGLQGERVQVDVLDGVRVVASSELDVNTSDEEHSVRLTFAPQKKEWAAYRVRTKLVQGVPIEGMSERKKDRIVENNGRDFALDNREKTFRILYFSGRPNWENKFVRRALENAPQLSMSSLIRISGAERKFVFRGRDATMANPLFEGFDDRAKHAPRYDEAVYIRIGVGESELASGYPLTAEELFRYHLVIWSEIERGFFSQNQLDLTRDFVSKRGGSLMLMGGPRSFAGGDWQHSVIEPMLPVVLGSAEGDDHVAFRPRPTMDGVLSGVWLLDSDPKKNAAKWESLPPLYGVNAFALTRAGASVLSVVDADQDGVRDRPLFAWQRYGEGTCGILATGETWQWQLMMPNADGSHERFWRQLARALVNPVPEPIVLTSGADEVRVGEVYDLRFLVCDSLFVPREGVTVSVTATDAEGGAVVLPVAESIEESGVYRASFRAGQPGLHQVVLTARDGAGVSIGQLETAVLAQPDYREFEDPRYHPEFLKALASHTGGTFLELDDLDQLVSHIPWTDSQNAVTDRFALWHWPPFYVALILLWLVEWYLRRKRGEP